MKKIIIFSSVLLLILAFNACAKKTAAPEAGSASVEDLLGLVPQDAKGVIFVDVRKAMATEFSRKPLEKDAKYQEFIQKTGIDPQNDIFFAAVAITETLEKGKTEAAALINMKYNQENLLAIMNQKAQEEGKEIQEEDYSGLTIYTAPDEKDEIAFAFADSSNLIAGSKASVKSMIDVLQKKKENVFKNQALSDLIAKSNQEAMVWGAVLVSSETLDKVKSGNPMLADLQGISAVGLFFDYKNKTLLAEVKMMNADAEKNKKIAEMLTGFKALGALAAGEKPEVGELMNKIEISSAADSVKISANIPEELISRLSKEKPDKEN